MGTNKTEHYGLHQWVPEDDFLRTDFNENFEKLDSALYTAEQNLRTDLTGDVQQLNTALDTLERELRADHDADITQVESALSTAQQTLRSEFNSSIQQVNTTLASVQALAQEKAKIIFGTYTGDGTANRAINLGITIKWILLIPQNGTMGGANGGLAAPNHPAQLNANSQHVRINGKSVIVSTSSENNTNSNTKSVTYYYLAAS